VTGAASVWLTVRARISNFGVGIANKRIENWGFWIAADLIYVPLYLVKRLDLAALVYLLFLGLCAAGATSWRRALRDGDQAPAPVSVARGGGA
jgi:nicotinamide mononucleotide transporter